MIIKRVGKQDGERPSIPIMCKGCGKALHNKKSSGYEVCNSCLKNRSTTKKTK